MKLILIILVFGCSLVYVSCGVAKNRKLGVILPPPGGVPPALLPDDNPENIPETVTLGVLTSTSETPGTEPVLDIVTPGPGAVNPLETEIHVTPGVENVQVKREATHRPPVIILSTGSPELEVVANEGTTLAEVYDQEATTDQNFESQPDIPEPPANIPEQNAENAENQNHPEIEAVPIQTDDSEPIPTPQDEVNNNAHENVGDRNKRQNHYNHNNLNDFGGGYGGYGGYGSGYGGYGGGGYGGYGGGFGRGFGSYGGYGYGR